MRHDALVVVAAVAAGFVVSAIWYSPPLFGGVWTSLREVDPAATGPALAPALKGLIEAVRELVVASALLTFVRLGRVVDWRGALRVGFWAWLGFPVAMLAGASLWDGKSWILSAIHAGDWLMKMLVMAGLIGAWGRR